MSTSSQHGGHSPSPNKELVFRARSQRAQRDSLRDPGGHVGEVTARKARGSESGRSVAPPPVAGIAEAVARLPGLHAARELGQPAAATASWHDARAHALTASYHSHRSFHVRWSLIPLFRRLLFLVLLGFSWRARHRSAVPLPFPLALDVAADARAGRPSWDPCLLGVNVLVSAASRALAFWSPFVKKIWVWLKCSYVRQR